MLLRSALFALLTASVLPAAAAPGASLLPVEDSPKRMPVERAPTDSITRPAMMETGESNGALAATPKRRMQCLSTRMIDRAQVIDDSTIRMKLGSKRYLDIKLRGTCYGLRFDESFYYQPGPTGELCERVDTIVTRSGHRCMIDAIVPVDPEKLKK